MSETIIKSSVLGSRDILVAQANGCIVISKVVNGNPMTSTLVAIPIEDFPAVFAALQTIINEIRERESI
ncbi:hypothetical protein GFL93_12690 [Rhizobium leguminosarum bv. viciae]|uniref:hypothetical protein n=1 Tax=Rhizobium TaxID=379 RepID=UPI00144103E0|nr:hypothetical protein [Rhizobium leguminosarum]NKK06718.1 hypothetical protein [Rhizobium leguminosarum bv. viciae]